MDSKEGKVMDLSKCGGICRGDCKHYAIGVECPTEATFAPKDTDTIKVIPNSYCPEGVVTCGPETAKQLKAELDRLTTDLAAANEENGGLRGALEKLVALKDYMDKVGKDHYYALEQCEAWSAAKSILTRQTDGKKERL